MKHILTTFLLILGAVSAWADDVASVTINGVTTNYATFDEAVGAANGGTDNPVPATLTLLGDVSGITSYVCLGNGSTDGVTLDLNGHSITGESIASGSFLLVVESAKKLTIKDTSTGGSGSIISGGYGIRNYGTLTVEGGTISGINGIFNDSGTLTVLGGTISGTSRGINNNGSLTFYGGTISGKQCIFSSGTLTLNALPTFGGENRTEDIYFYGKKSIAFGTDITVGENVTPIKVNIGSNYSPYVFTSGYRTHVKDATGQPIDPARLFSVVDRSGTAATVTLNTDGEAVAGIPVAEVTANDETTTYTDFNEAVSAANGAIDASNHPVSATIKLIYNATISNDITLGNGSTDGVTLDLNGYRLTMKSQSVNIIDGTKLTISGSDSKNAINCSLIANSGTLTVEGGIIGGTSSTTTATTGINNTGTLTVKGGTIKGTDTDIYNNGTLTVEGGIIGDISGTTGINNTGTLTVSGGTIRGTSTGIDNKGTLTLNALPTFSSSKSCHIRLGENKTIGFSSNISVPSGTKINVETYNNAIYRFTSGYSQYVSVDPASLFTVKYNGGSVEGSVEGSVILIEGEAVVKAPDATYAAYVTYGSQTVGCATLGDAVSTANNAGSPAAITLLQNCTGINDPMVLGSTAGVTLDLNGHNLSSNYSFREDYLISVSENAKLTVKDSGTGGSIDSYGYNAIVNNGFLDVDGGGIMGIDLGIFNNGTLTVRGGCAVCIGNYGTLTISGGKVESFSGLENNTNAIVNDNTLIISGGTVWGEYNGIVNYGTLTVSGGIVGGDDNGITNEGGLTVSGGKIDEIANHGTLTLNALPGSVSDRSPIIYLGEGKTIGFGADFSDDTSGKHIEVDIDFQNNLPYTFTTGYDEHVKYAEGHTYAGQTVDPADLFDVKYNAGTDDDPRNGSVILIGGEAKAITGDDGTAGVSFAREGYATYYDSSHDLILPAGMKAWVVSASTPGANGVSTVGYQLIAGDGTGTNVVPVATAMLLQTPAASDPIQANVRLTTNSGATFNGTNLLHGRDYDGTTTGDGKHYKLTYGTDDYSDILGWYWGSTDGAPFTTGAHKAWLVLPAAGARAFLPLPGYDEVSGIDDVRVGGDAEWYSLDGRRLDDRNLKKGIYIHGGRKVVVK